MQDFVTILLMTVLIACLVPSGCVQSSAGSSVPMAVTATVVPPQEPALTGPAEMATSAPVEVVTIVRYISPIRDLKDSRLLFALQVPAEWNVSTLRMTNSDTSYYRTDLVAGEVFSIWHYPVNRAREQEFRDRFRLWVPAPVENPVTINGIRYDRYESRAAGNTTVALLARTSSANERGYGSVLIYTARECNRFEQEEFEKAVASFRYFSIRSAATQTGDEIPVYDLSGKPVSGTMNPLVSSSTDWDTAGGDWSDAGSSASSSSSGSSGGGHCGG